MKRSAIARTSGVKKKRGTSAAKEKAKATKLWGEYIHKRDVVCRFCGRADGKLDAHHVLIRTFSSTRTDENNGVLLCYRDHQLMHSDSLEAVRFYVREFGGDDYLALRQKAYDGVGGKYPASFWVDEQRRLQKLLEEL